MKLEFYGQSFEKCQFSWPFLPWEPKMDAEKTDKTQLIVVFRSFANAPENVSQGHFVSYSLHMIRPRMEPYPVQWEASD
jgi:hypothetical protein